jgi:hypothetical protein
MNLRTITFTLLFVFHFLTGCNIGGDPNYIRMSDRIVNQYLKDMKDLYGLNCFGSGGGFLERINVIILSFKTQGPKAKKN